MKTALKRLHRFIQRSTLSMSIAAALIAVSGCGKKEEKQTVSQPTPAALDVSRKDKSSRPHYVDLANLGTGNFSTNIGSIAVNVSLSYKPAAPLPVPNVQLWQTDDIYCAQSSDGSTTFISTIKKYPISVEYVSKGGDYVAKELFYGNRLNGRLHASSSSNTVAPYGSYVAQQSITLEEASLTNGSFGKVLITNIVNDVARFFASTYEYELGVIPPPNHNPDPHHNFVYLLGKDLYRGVLWHEEPWWILRGFVKSEYISRPDHLNDLDITYHKAISSEIALLLTARNKHGRTAANIVVLSNNFDKHFVDNVNDAIVKAVSLCETENLSTVFIEEHAQDWGVIENGKVKLNVTDRQVMDREVVSIKYTASRSVSNFFINGIYRSGHVGTIVKDEKSIEELSESSVSMLGDTHSFDLATFKKINFPEFDKSTRIVAEYQTSDKEVPITMYMLEKKHDGKNLGAFKLNLRGTPIVLGFLWQEVNAGSIEIEKLLIAGYAGKFPNRLSSEADFDDWELSGKVEGESIVIKKEYVGRNNRKAPASDSETLIMLKK